jgi:hypothetical protein
MSVEEFMTRSLQDAVPVKVVIANAHNAVYVAVSSHLSIKGWAEAMVPISICLMNLGIFFYYVKKITTLKKPKG